MEVNYIQHLNKVFRRFSNDENLKAVQISLYMALFQMWNMAHFPEILYVNRQEVMRTSKIGSLKTYHRGLWYLNDRRYIRYFPSHDPQVGSRIKLLIFKEKRLGKKGTTKDTTTGITREHQEEQVVPPFINCNKQLKTLAKPPSSENVVVDFFKRKKWPEIEARKFFNHYKSTGWKIGGKAKIHDWEAAAENWMIKAGERKRDFFKDPENLKTSKFKNYGEPL
ncbi:hypothetical protein SAMN04488034_10373 [Salinimicrobium catena]|uniref:Uncharacterized protein n=2 Tax=Salinimicrobium catena TaxID=390640 RepID=A0A1H5MTT5_9FLAO|nr:hypothetical protein SAMN04488140_10373 [Salinimicrobium catena]SEE92167.1 hypothetical protein SAMN04488034_10373 [Salinimicrobium catena]